MLADAAVARLAPGLGSHAVALYLATRDPRAIWCAKSLAALIAAYAFSPIDARDCPCNLVALAWKVTLAKRCLNSVGLNGEFCP
jgi:hypothetical protein